MSRILDKVKDIFVDEDEAIDYSKCNHDPNDENTSLLVVKRRNMIVPDERGFVCPECGKSFIFKRNNGKYVLKR